MDSPARQAVRTRRVPLVPTLICIASAALLLGVVAYGRGAQAASPVALAALLLWIAAVLLAVAVLYVEMRRRERHGPAESAPADANDALARRVAELAQLSQHLLSTAEQEKARIARELHDALGSNLTAVDIDVKWVEKKLREREPELAERLQRALSVLERAVAVERDVIEALRPSLLDTLGLVTALESLCEAFTRRTGLDVVPDLDPDLRALPPEASIALYRVVQEALANVREHAQAKLVRVALQRENEHLRLVIEDDGVGIPEDALADPRAHGLVGMRERLRLLGGTLLLRRGANGRGTVVDATVPQPGP